MASRTISVAFLDPDSAIPRGCYLMGYFVDGRRVSEREAMRAHRRGERVITRPLERTEVPIVDRRN